MLGGQSEVWSWDDDGVVVEAAVEAVVVEEFDLACLVMARHDAADVQSRHLSSVSKM